MATTTAEAEAVTLPLTPQQQRELLAAYERRAYALMRRLRHQTDLIFDLYCWAHGQYRYASAQRYGDPVLGERELSVLHDLYAAYQAAGRRESRVQRIWYHAQARLKGTPAGYAYCAGRTPHGR